MREYSEYTKKYVQDICDALNEVGIKMKDFEETKDFSPQHFETLTKFLQNYVVMPLAIFTFLDEKGLVNRGRCPYTGQLIDKSFPKWTYMRHRSIYVSHEGYQIMRKEDDEDYEEVFGKPAPQRKPGGCYIATVCYGSELAPEVIALKYYRDNVLAKSKLGRLFTKLYYYTSPTIAKILKNKPMANKFIKDKLLDKIIKIINR
ncbi:hypothetical protein QQ054_27080 [Oscillatoria amoena NRMC-F 0135]|nr:hypothetical protein [Oscillatoria amoena NRMC-F 0135]